MQISLFPVFIMISFLLFSFLTFVELNCENLFDCVHDSATNDVSFMPDGAHKWTAKRYWNKLDNIGRILISCGENQDRYGLPDMAMLCEVENDSVLRDLTKRSLLRNADYDYVITHSADPRGIDIAFIYQPFSFSLLDSHTYRVLPPEGMHPTRDILYVKGTIATGDTLHVLGVHAPSRLGGQKRTLPYRMKVANCLTSVIDSIRRISINAKIIIAGDFNASENDSCLKLFYAREMINVTSKAIGSHGAKGTYRYDGNWEHIDHVLVSRSLATAFCDSHINDLPFLIEKEKKYGGVRPMRTFNGLHYQRGYSDHLALVVRFRL